MWLDRFSNQPTPNGSPPPPQSRSFSPAPRRQNHLAPVPLPRPKYSPRPSSLTLDSKTNSSTTSLPGTSRVPNGSTLKRELTPPPDVGNPLDILQSIIGPTVGHSGPFHSQDGEAVGRKPQTLASDLEFDGLSLQEFAESEEHSGVPNLLPRYQESKQSAEECEYVCLLFNGMHTLLIKL